MSTQPQEYAKLKNADLESLLKDRGLVHTGKKADMVARLVEHDNSTGTAPASLPVPSASRSSKSKSPGAAAAPEPSRSADGAATANGADAKIATSEPAAAAIAAGGATRADNPQAVPNQKVDEEDPAATSDLKVTRDTSTSASGPVPMTEAIASTDGAADPAPEVPAVPAQDFSANLEKTDVEGELEKRRKRAAKFGVVEGDEEAAKALERAKRFGTGVEGEGRVKGLDEALPERQRKRRGEGGEGGDEKRRRGGGGERPGVKRQESGVKREGTQQVKREGSQQGKREGSQAKGDGRGTPGWMTEKDREAAERRKAKFGS